MGCLSFKEAKDRMINIFHNQYITSLLRESGGNISKAAEMAGIQRQYLHRLMKEAGIEAEQLNRRVNRKGDTLTSPRSPEDLSSEKHLPADDSNGPFVLDNSNAFEVVRHHEFNGVNDLVPHLHRGVKGHAFFIWQENLLDSCFSHDTKAFCLSLPKPFQWNGALSRRNTRAPL